MFNSVVPVSDLMHNGEALLSFHEDLCYTFLLQILLPLVDLFRLLVEYATIVDTSNILFLHDSILGPKEKIRCNPYTY